MTGFLLINVGTPDEPTTSSVRRYLRQFLSDGRVIDVNPVSRWLLLNLFILPFRPAKSAAAYRKVWTDAGSPLRVYSEALVGELRKRIPEARFELAMRYGQPSIAAGIGKLFAAGVQRLVLVPMYPHYAASSTGTSLAEAYRVLSEPFAARGADAVPAFFDRDEYLDAFVAVGRPILDREQPDHVLFSYHGLPERQLRKGDPTGQHCLVKSDCCATITDVNRDCYRAQAFATSRSLIARLGLDPARTSTAFQSRLGRTPWIRPFTDELLVELPKKGIKKLVVFCPAFVADCLETLEEIGIRAAESWRAAGGESLTLVPSLNASPAWVDGMEKLVRPYLGAR